MRPSMAPSSRPSPSLEQPQATGHGIVGPDPPRRSRSRRRPALALPRRLSNCTWPTPSFPIASNNLMWRPLLTGAAGSDPFPLFTPALVSPSRACTSAMASL
ncbi:hypothetical protein D1007_17271 [Hordeum vulgare]|nr:hypothetical protein D1007_17271 [Hordeum vulgare]